MEGPEYYSEASISDQSSHKLTLSRPDNNGLDFLPGHKFPPVHYLHVLEFLQIGLAITVVRTLNQCSVLSSLTCLPVPGMDAVRLVRAIDQITRSDSIGNTRIEEQINSLKKKIKRERFSTEELLLRLLFLNHFLGTRYL